MKIEAGENISVPENVVDDPLDYDSSDPTSSGAFEIEKTGRELEAYIDEIADTVRIGLDQSIAILTPWFFNNMPKVYYQTTPRPEKVRHLSAIISGHVFETKQTVELWARDRSKVTFIGPGGDNSVLMNMAQKMSGQPLKMGSLYFSRDNLLFLSTFMCRGYQPLDKNNPRITNKVEAARKLLTKEFPDDPQVASYLDNLDNDFVMYATPARIRITYRMVRHMMLHEGAYTFVEPFENSPLARLTLGFKNLDPGDLIEQILSLLDRYGYNIVRSFVISFKEGLEEPIAIFHFIIGHRSVEKVEPKQISMIKLNKALRTLGWIDNDEYSEFTKAPHDLSLNGANYLRSLASWVHIQLSKQNHYYYSQHKIRTTFTKYPDLTRNLVDLFRCKFDNLLTPEERETNCSNFRRKAAAEIDEVIDRVERSIFRECLNFTDHILKTNYFLRTKTGLAFRLDPRVLNPEYYPNQPFAIFFITGRDYRLFHVRWKDISRGGLRVVMPRNSTDYDYALTGLFDEVYGLSYAQQMKNKDIPEGGSKAVLLLKPNGRRHQAVRGAINALLDLLVAEDEAHEAGREQLVSYYDKNEIIYLGPDENMTNDLIEWVPLQAQRRSYRYARAFMSSKPSDGINHKQYGVTSEGLNVYVDNALHFIGIDPKKQRFTVKMTGGPDGDVAGNELKILHREYGENARVVAIADGFGCASDPEGLAWPELLRLVREGLSICEFKPEHLSKSKDAYVIRAETREEIRTRDSLHFVADADVFIPAGGRPYTVNESNWQRFINSENRLTIRAIVEGANIFFTAEARQKLQEKGALIFKDSSANKTGVICSSYEIIAALTLSSEEFLAIKEQYVNEVLTILRKKADLEAKLLIHEYEKCNRKKNLVTLSTELSAEINGIMDILLDQLQEDPDCLKDPLFQSLIMRHCPPHTCREIWGPHSQSDSNCPSDRDRFSQYRGLRRL